MKKFLIFSDFFLHFQTDVVFEDSVNVIKFVRFKYDKWNKIAQEVNALGINADVIIFQIGQCNLHSWFKNKNFTKLRTKEMIRSFRDNYVRLLGEVKRTCAGKIWVSFPIMHPKLNE